MHTLRHHLLSALAATLTLLAVVPLHSAAPGKSQQLTSPDQVPEGLAKSDWSSIRAAYEAGRHAFQPVEGQEGAWKARNPGQQWTTQFDQRGFIALPKDGGWSWGLELQSYGFGEKQKAVGGTPAVKAEGQRLSYQWDATVQEWFVNDQRGLEHGFTISQRPEADPPLNSQPPTLNFLLTTRGSLSPKVAADAQGVSFQDASGATVLNYAGLKVWDADGKTLASRFEAAGEGRVRLRVEESTARYPITIDPVAQQAYLKASNSGAYDNFGWSVAVSGDTVVIGALGESSSATGVNGDGTNDSASYSGAAYVFTRSGATWYQQAYLKASNSGAGDLFGVSVAVSGDTAVIGAYQEDSNATGVNGDGTNNSASYSGAAYVFTRSGATWSQQAYLKASNSGAFDYFGYSVAVSGGTAVIGAYGEASNATGVNGDGTNNSANASGATYVFTRSGTTWSQQAYLKASNSGAGDLFGCSVAVSGDTAVIGALGEDSNATGVNGNQADNSASDFGAVYVFTRSGATWSQHAYLKARNSGEDYLFGRSVAVSGDTLVIGALVGGIYRNGDFEYSPGSAFVSTRSGATWSQPTHLKSSNSTAWNSFGCSVSVSGDTAVIGANEEANNLLGPEVGAAYTFTGLGPVPGDLDPLNANANSFFVASTAVQPDGKTIIAGSFTSVLGVARNNIARLNADGTLDLNFNPNVNNEVCSIAVQADGKVLLGDFFTTVGGTTRNRIARLNADGTLDAGFNPNADNDVYSIVLLADGKVLIGGDFTTVGGTTRNRIARLNASGTLDAGFNPNANNSVLSVVLQADGKILLGGSFTAVGGTGRNRIARLNADGTLDAGFNPNADNAVYSIVLQADGKILLGGIFYRVGMTSRIRIARVDASGVLDAGFNPSADNAIVSMAVQADGKILLGGFFTSVGGTTRNHIARLDASGALDLSFAPNADSNVYSVALQADGKILLGGEFNSVGGTSRSNFARLLNDPATQTLTTPGRTQVTWTRRGTSPEVSQVTFELSTNGGISYTQLGRATRLGSTPNWQLSGLSLPPSGQLRARGRTTNGYLGGGSGMVESVASFTFPPAITAISPTSGTTLGGTSVTITGTNLTGATGVTIGGAAATGVIVVNATTIKAITPARAVGTASVLVTTPGGTNAANTLYTYSR